MSKKGAVDDKPRVAGKTQVNVYLPDELAAWLRETSDEEGIKMSRKVQSALELYRAVRTEETANNLVAVLRREGLLTS